MTQRGKQLIVEDPVIENLRSNLSLQRNDHRIRVSVLFQAQTFPSSFQFSSWKRHTLLSLFLISTLVFSVNTTPLLLTTLPSSPGIPSLTSLLYTHYSLFITSKTSSSTFHNIYYPTTPLLPSS